MRGDVATQTTMLSLTTADQLVPSDHPIREIKPIVDHALAELSPTFDLMYSKMGRPSIPPEHLLKSCVLIALYSVRSERQFCEQLQYNLLFKWFLDLNVVDAAFDASTFSKNKERLLEHDVARQFFCAVLTEADGRDLLSDEHFSVDGTLFEAWASMKSFRPKSDGGDGPALGRNPDADFRGERRSNESHASRTDPDARLMRKGLGKEAKLCFAGHVLMENRNGLVVDISVTHATGTAEREAALQMVDRLPRKGRVTLAGDKGYDTADFVKACRGRGVTPRVAQKKHSAIDGRTTRHPGYAISQRIRKRVEEVFGWSKTVGGGWKLRYVGIPRNQMWAELTVTAFNLVRMANLARAPV